MDEADSETRTVAEGSSGADSVFDPAVALSRMRYPSSMGMTFAVDVTMTPEVVVEVGAASYRQTDEKDRESPWVREAASTEPVSVDTKKPRSGTVTVCDGLDVYVVVRPAVGRIVFGHCRARER